jgi:hypothetical protein
MAAMTFFLHCKPMQAHWDTRIKDAKCYPVNLFVDFALINTCILSTSDRRLMRS